MLSWYHGAHNQTHAMFFTVFSAASSTHKGSTELPRVSCEQSTLGPTGVRREDSLPSPRGLEKKAVPTPSQHPNHPGGPGGSREVSGAGEALAPYPQPQEIPQALSTKVLTVLLYLAVSMIYFGVIWCHASWWYHLSYLQVQFAADHILGRSLKFPSFSFPPFPFLSSSILDTALASKVMRDESVFLKAWPRFLLALKAKTDTLTLI